MKKILSYTILLTIVAIITISGTYAVFTATAESGNDIDLNAHQIHVIYDGDEEIDGKIQLVEKKEDGFRRVVSIGLANDSVVTYGNIYIYLDQISEGLSTDALKWELYQINTETDDETGTEIENETLIDKGTFLGTQSETKVYLLQELEITEEIQQFAIYIWLNGHEAGNEVRGASLRGFIGAESGIVSGVIS